MAPPPDTALHDLPYHVHCPVTDSLMQVTSTGVPGGQSLLVARTLHLQKKPKVVLRVGQTPALPASLRCLEQVFLEVTFQGLPGGQRLLITCDRVFTTVLWSSR